MNREYANGGFEGFYVDNTIYIYRLEDAPIVWTITSETGVTKNYACGVEDECLKYTVNIQGSVLSLDSEEVSKLIAKSKRII